MANLAATLHLHRNQEISTHNFTTPLRFVVVEIDDLKLFFMEGTADTATRLANAFLEAAAQLTEGTDAEA